MCTSGEGPCDASVGQESVERRGTCSLASLLGPHSHNWGGVGGVGGSCVCVCLGVRVSMVGGVPHKNESGGWGVWGQSCSIALSDVRTFSVARGCIDLDRVRLQLRGGHPGCSLSTRLLWMWMWMWMWTRPEEA